MAVPWLRLIDGVLGARDVIRVVRNRALEAPAEPSASALEAPLAGVVVSALREAFNRDSERLDLERRRLDDERARAADALRLEMLRQAGEREIGRLRLLAIVALASLLGSLFLVTRLVGGEVAARGALGLGWCCLLAALAAAFAAQAQVGRMLVGADARTPGSDITGTPGGNAAPWLIVGGLAAIALGVLLA